LRTYVKIKDHISTYMPSTSKKSESAHIQTIPIMM
jgi:hypothetical protein